MLHKLFKPVDEAQAILMVAFALVRVPISFVSIANNLDVLALLSGVGKVNVLSPADVNAQVMLQLATAANQTFVAELFWGLWLFPFGLLVYRSGFLPKVLGTFLMARCVGYLIDPVSQVMWPVSYRASGVSAFVNLPSAAGEIGTCLWMLIMGRRRRAPTCLAREVDEVRCALQRRRQFRGPAERSMSSRGRGARGQLYGDATTLWSGALCLEAQIIKHFQYTVAAVSQKA